MLQDIEKLQQIIKNANKLHISSKRNSNCILNIYNYSGVVEYYPEELVITIKAGTITYEIQKILAKNNQVLPFFIDDNNASIGAVYANGGSDLADNVLGIQIIDGTGDLLNFGGQVMKNVAGYDVSRLLVGSKGMLALITQISFKILPQSYMSTLKTPNVAKKQTSALHKKIEQKLKQVFDPKGIFI